MPNISARAEMSVSYEVDSILSILEIGTRQLRALQSREFKELVARNPDCDVSVSRYAPTIELYSWAQIEPNSELFDLVDISDISDSADYEGYCVRVQEPLGQIHGVRISRRISVDQRYTSEERELLRSMGRLQQQTHTSDTLVCGV